MLVSLDVYRRLPVRLRWHFNLQVKVPVGGRVILVPAMHGVGIEPTLLGPSWKSAAIADLAAGRSGTFVDVGANMGQTLVDSLIAGATLRYVGFEPSAHCCVYLEALARANALRDWRVVAAGLGSRSGLCPIYLHDENDPAASLIPDLRPSLTLDTRFISIHAFDEIRDTLGIDRVGLVKIDVEGAEAGVVRGMLRTLERDRPPVLCEVLTADRHASLAANDARNAELLSHLALAGYRVARLQKTPDESRLLGIEPVKEFPSAYWSPATAHLCDYLFFPAESANEVLGSLTSMSRYVMRS